MKNSNIFIVHGHDGFVKNDLAQYIKNIGLTPIILQEQEGFSGTLIEKFEFYANKCSFALVLLTPDDHEARDFAESDKWRARQNVILEMGWFMAKLSRRGVILIYKGIVELPSDITGVEYYHFSDSIFEVMPKIRTALQKRGVI